MKRCLIALIVGIGAALVAPGAVPVAAVAQERCSVDGETVIRHAEGNIVEAYCVVGGYRFDSALPSKDMSDNFAAGCRVSVPGARGSGTFNGFRNGKCVVSTNQHVVGKSETNVVLQFQGTGARVDIRGKVFARWFNANALYDFALIEVEPSEMAKTGAKYVPLGGADCSPAVDSFILSAGAPKGRFVQAWRGKVLEYYNGSTCLFEPGPVPGQSGSGIISEIDGRLWQTGILTWLIGTEGADDSKGGAIPISKLYEAARGKKAAYPVEESPIPPDAKECVEADPLEVANKSDVPFVFEFSMDNCEPCKRAEKDVIAIRANGIPVYCLNISLSKDSEQRADDLRVYKYPTFIVFTAEGKETARFEGPGVSLKVIAAAQAALPPVEETEPVEILPRPDVEESEPIELEPLGEDLAVDASDFRKRAPIEQPADGDFFDDMDARWRNRNRGVSPSRPETPETPPREPQSPPPSIDEGKLGDRIGGILGGRLKGDLKDSLGKELDGAIGELEKRFDKKIEDKMNEYGGKLLNKYERLKFRVFMWFIGSVIVSVFFAEAVKALVSLVCGAIAKWFRAIVNKEAARIAAKAAKVVELTAPKGDALASIDAGVDDLPE